MRRSAAYAAFRSKPCRIEPGVSSARDPQHQGPQRTTPRASMRDGAELTERIEIVPVNAYVGSRTTSRRHVVDDRLTRPTLWEPAYTSTAPCFGPRSTTTTM